MTPRQQRMLTVGLIIAGVTVAVGLTLQAFEENLEYFYDPTEILSGEAPADRRIRLGGLVTDGSIRRVPGSLEVSFEVTDTQNAMQVVYSGVLPDLFRDGQGVIATGFVRPDGTFLAEEVLAKHDENYMPPEVAESLAEKGHPVGAGSATAAN